MHITQIKYTIIERIFPFGYYAQSIYLYKYVLIWYAYIMIKVRRSTQATPTG